MKYITWIIAAYAALAMGVNVAHANGVVEMKFDDINVVAKEGNITGCLVDVNGEQQVYLADCQALAKKTIAELKKDEPNAFLHVTINGVEINKS